MLNICSQFIVATYKIVAEGFPATCNSLSLEVGGEVSGQSALQWRRRCEIRKGEKLLIVSHILVTFVVHSTPTGEHLDSSQSLVSVTDRLLSSPRLLGSDSPFWLGVHSFSCFRSDWHSKGMIERVSSALITVHKGLLRWYIVFCRLMGWLQDVSSLSLPS